MKNKILTSTLVFVTAIVSGYFLYELLKKIGLGETFDFDLFEDIDNEEQL